ncbi:SWIM zinc finger family protein [Neobacillus sp. Marseille-QA0830]
MAYENEIQGLAAQLAGYVDPNDPDDAKLVQSGLMLYRQERVKQLQFWKEYATSTVQDVSPCYVKLNYTFLSESSCSCPVDGFCRHRMATFFAAYSQIGSVTDWVSEWREPMREQASFSKWGMQKAKDLIKANGVLKPDYSRWVQSFEVSFDTLLASKKYTSAYVIPELFGIYKKRIGASAPVEQEWHLLYDLVSSVVSFRKLAVLSEQLGHDEDTVRRVYIHLFHNLMDDIADLTDKISVQTMPFAFDEFIERLKDDTFEVLTCTKRFELERIYVHRLLWTELFKNKEWRQEEVLKIGDRLKRLEEWENPVPLEIATAHLYFLLGNEELALKFINRMDDVVVTPYLVYWIGYFSASKVWSRAFMMIELLLQKLKGYMETLGSYHSRSKFTRNVLRTVAPYCGENDRLDLYERVLLVTLPYSFAEYEYLLFERGQYDRWGELNAFVGMSFQDLPKERVKVVEKEQPEVLLGLLHQSAQQEIDQKNRSSYRHAVRHLKKLRTLYKKLKRVDDWEYFIGELLDRTKRLRAFHEECQRSKLI